VHETACFQVWTPRSNPGYQFKVVGKLNLVSNHCYQKWHR